MADGAVLRMTAGMEEFATTTGAEETIGVTIGATGVEEMATGVALVATTGYVLVHGQSLIVKVVASVTVWILPLIEREVADEQ